MHLSAACAKAHQAGPLITLPRQAGDDPLAVGRAAFARRVVVAESAPGASMELALRVLEAGPGAPMAATRPKVAVHLHDPVTAERIHHLPGGLDLFAFSEAQVCARAVLFRHPPFLLARRIKAKAAHVLILGFGRLGQAIASDIAVNSLVSDLGAPHIRHRHRGCGRGAGFLLKAAAWARSFGVCVAAFALQPPPQRSDRMPSARGGCAGLPIRKMLAFGFVLPPTTPARRYASHPPTTDQPAKIGLRRETRSRSA